MSVTRREVWAILRLAAVVAAAAAAFHARSTVDRLYAENHQLKATIERLDSEAVRGRMPRVVQDGAGKLWLCEHGNPQLQEVPWVWRWTDTRGESGK